MNRKKTLRIIIAILAIALACILPFIFANNKDKPQDAPTTEAQTQATSTPALPTVEESTLNELPSTTQKKNPLASIVGKCWFLYDKDENSCYAFLIKDDGNADIAYFGAETLDGLDAQYSTGYSVYTVSDSSLTFKDMPDNFPISSFTFDIKDDRLFYKGTELKSYDEISLKNALKHYSDSVNK